MSTTFETTILAGGLKLSYDNVSLFLAILMVGASIALFLIKLWIVVKMYRLEVTVSSKEQALVLAIFSVLSTLILIVWAVIRSAKIYEFYNIPEWFKPGTSDRL